ncbi:MAG: glycosyl hydrolase, partial [Blastocatellia bacterium]
MNVVDAFGIGSKLSDNSYAYGYYVNAAALLAIALQQSAIPGLTADQMKWWDKDHFGPAIDLLIKDIAYAEKAGDAAIPWWADQQKLPFPRLEFMDLWTGVAYADAFTSRSEFGKQHNSAQEAQIAWAGVHLWGKVTGRKPLADLGAFLYTLGAYSNDAYFNGALGQLTPDVSAGEFVADYSADGSFIPRATAASLANNGGCWNINDPQQLVTNGRGLSAWQSQPFANFTTGTALPFLTAGVYQGRQWYQGEFGVEPLNCLANLVLPLEPMTLSTLRDTAYMSNLAASTLNGSQEPFYNASYGGVLNKLFAAVGLKQSASALYLAPSAQPLPLPCNDPRSWPPAIPFNNCGAFRTLDTSSLNVAATDWFWNTYTSGVGQIPNSDAQYTPWQGQAVPRAPVTCDLLKLDDYFTTPSDGAGSFVDFHYFEAFGSPNFTVYAQTTDPVAQQPVGVAFTKGTVTHFVAHNPNDLGTLVQFKTVSGDANFGPPLGIPPHGSAVWSTGSKFGAPAPGHPRVVCNSLCFRSAQYFLNNLNRLPGGAVVVPGVNFNNPVSTNSTAVQQALRGGNAAGARFSRQYVAAQLNL